MFKSFGVRVWRLGPLPFIALIVVVQLGAFVSGNADACRAAYQHLVQFVQAHPVLWLPLTAVLVMVLAYLQNTAYAMQSRAGMRNSNAYHLLAAVAASFTFFVSLQLLVRNELPLVLLAPYVFATVMATLHGNQLSIRIEKALHIYVENLKGSAQIVKLWPSVAVLVALLIWQVYDLGMRGVPVMTQQGPRTLGIWDLSLVVVLGIIGSLTFALLRTARSSDSYWFHTVAFLLNTAAEFVKLAILVKFRLTWELFIPVTTGSVIGSLIGANIALDITERIKAKFNVHVFDSKKEKAALEQFLTITRPTRQVAILSCAFLVQAALVLLGYASLYATALLTVLSAWQQMSFTLKSRAGQRNEQRYLAWSSIFSNGVWYITLAPLAMGGITHDEAIPYIIGGAIGSLVGQLAGMHIERLTGALTSEPAPSKPAAALA